MEIDPETLMDDAPGNPDGAPSLYAWIAIDAMGGEGIIASILPGLGAAPLVTTREDLARGLMAESVRIMPKMGRRYVLRRYDLARDLLEL